MPSLSAKPGSGTPNSASQSFGGHAHLIKHDDNVMQRGQPLGLFSFLHQYQSSRSLCKLDRKYAGHSPLLFVSRASGECSGSAGSSIRTKGKFAYESNVTQHNDPSDISSGALLPCPASTATPARTDSCEERLQRRPPAGVGHPLFRPS